MKNIVPKNTKMRRNKNKNKNQDKQKIKINKDKKGNQQKKIKATYKTKNAASLRRLKRT